MNYNQYIQNKITDKLFMKAINYVCFKLEGKIARGIKNNKRNFISVIEDKFAMSIK